MSKETMSLKMQILATGSQALGEMEKVRKGAQAIGRDLRAIGGYASGGLNLLLAPLKIGAGLAAGMAASLGALGLKAINAAAADEVLVQRLEAVYGSAKKAASVFKEVEAISRISPFNPKQLVDSIFVLKQFGLASKQNLGILAATARAANVPIEELAQQLAIMQMRGLKKFGITLESGAGSSDTSTVIKYRDRMGQIRRIIAKDSEAARKDLLKIFQLKFGSSFETGTLSGLKAVFGNLFEQSFARVGDAMLPAAKSFVGAINAELKHFIEGGTAEEWGKRAGKWLTESVDKIIAAWQTMKTIAGQMEDNWDKGGAGIGGIVSAAITGGISFLLTTMFRVLGASVDVWAGIGKVLGAALIETILQIPGLGPMRDSMAIANINSMSQAEREQTAKKYGTYDSSAKSIEVYAMSHPKVAREIAVGDQNANLLKAIKGMMTIGPDLLTGIQADMAAYRATVDAALAGAGMSGITSTYEANLARRKSARYAQENPGVAKDYAQMIKLRSGALPGRQSWNLVRQAQKFSWLGVTDAPTSGPRAASGKLPTTINIGTVQVQANDAWTFVQSLGYNARSPILAAASL